MNKAKLTIVVISAIILLYFISFSNVMSPSMYPSIKIYDVLICLKVPAKTLQEGDVIKYKRDNINIIHRIDKIIHQDGQIFYQTKGDYNYAVDDQLISADDIKGKVILRIPQLGRVQWFLFLYVIIFMKNLLTKWRKFAILVSKERKSKC